MELAKEVCRAALDHFPGVYLITPFLNYETTVELAQFVRARLGSSEREGHLQHVENLARLAVQIGGCPGAGRGRARALFRSHRMCIERMQQRVGQMEWWGALLYPLLVAACNLLLFPAAC